MTVNLFRLTKVLNAKCYSVQQSERHVSRNIRVKPKRDFSKRLLFIVYNFTEKHSNIGVGPMHTSSYIYYNNILTVWPTMYVPCPFWLNSKRSTIIYIYIVTIAYIFSSSVTIVIHCSRSVITQMREYLMGVCNFHQSSKVNEYMLQNIKV